MATAAITVNYINDGGRAGVIDTLSVASRVSQSVQSRMSMGLRFIHLAANLWKLDSHLARFLQSVYSNMENAEEKKASAEKSENVTREQVENAIRSLRSLYTSLDGIHERSRAARLTNNSLVSASLNSIHARNEEVLDLVDWLEAVLDEEFLKRHAEDNARAIAELSRGEVFDLSQVR